MRKRLNYFTFLFMLFAALVFVVSPAALVAAEEEGEVQLYLKGMEMGAYQTEYPYDLMKDGYFPGEAGPYIISCVGPIEEFYEKTLTELGVQVIEYIPDFAFLVIMTPEVAVEVEKLEYVGKVQLYQPAYKIEPTLKDEYGNLLVNKEVVVAILTFGNEDTSKIKDEIINAGGEAVYEDQEQVVAILYSDKLGGLAHLNSVKFIEIVPEFTLLNNVAAGVMDVDPIWNLGYDGQDQIVAVCDSGLDTGKNDSTMHLDFQGRIDAIYALGRSIADDPHGHGTHVAGSVLGSGARSGGTLKGIAPKAHLVFQSVLDSRGNLGGIPFDLRKLFQQAWDDGARIHTNSWGAIVNGLYTSKSRAVDDFVWKNDMIILFAAGNEGTTDGQNILYTTINAPGTAKNCITVGASENDRPRKGWLSDNPDQVAVFSSRGWTKDYRVKPDVVAPGTWILSTRSSKAPDSTFWGNYNSYYAYMCGSSMATPLTAGAVAVARQFIQNEWNHTPSAAMMKAVLINGAVDMGYGIPSRDQGWGRVNLVNSLAGKEYRFIDETDSFFFPKQTKKVTYTIESSNTPFTVTLAWTDYPGSTTASKALVNDLDLKITSPSGTVYYGNQFKNLFEPIFPNIPYKPTFDRRNNVENVVISLPEIGRYTVEIIAYNVPKGPQPFALFTSADFALTIGDIDLPYPY